MRSIAIGLCSLFLSIPAVTTHGPVACAKIAGSSIKAEASANGVGWKQFLHEFDDSPIAPRLNRLDGHASRHMSTTTDRLPSAPELTSWMLMIGGLAFAGSILHRRLPTHF